VSDKFTKSAKGRECQIRIPNQCLGSTETVVLCHLRMTGISGFGIKAPSQLATFGCFRCHQIVDGQRNSTYTADERRLFLLEGMARTQAIWIREGLLK
jgi:hypothetical protein